MNLFENLQKMKESELINDNSNKQNEFVKSECEKYGIYEFDNHIGVYNKKFNTDINEFINRIKKDGYKFIEKYDDFSYDSLNDGVGYIFIKEINGCRIIISIETDFNDGFIVYAGYDEKSFFDKELFENLKKFNESNNDREPIKCLQNDKGDIINIYKDKETGALRGEGDIPGESFNGPWDDKHERYYKSRGFKEIKENNYSPMEKALNMSETELRNYVKQHNLIIAYRKMLNAKPNYSYINQLKVLRDLVADDIATHQSKYEENLKESYDDSPYDDFPYDPFQESDPDDYYNEMIDEDEPTEYTVELYKTHNDVQPIRKRFDNIIDAENFAKNNTNGYSEVFISSSTFNGPSIINSWSKETGWFHKLSESIEEEESGLKVCSHCLDAIVSREGKQNIVNTYEFDSFDEDAKPLVCEWCDEEVDKLYEIDNIK